MSPKLTELLTAAMALSPAEREELADSLWASLDPPDAFAGMTEDEFVAELNRRAAELKSDPSLGVPWEEVRVMRNAFRRSDRSA
jgi:putative addiction module component (TIGR02574 family)